VDAVDWKDKNCNSQLFVKFSKTEMEASWGMPTCEPEITDITIEPIAAEGVKLFPAKSLEAGDNQHFVPLTSTFGHYHFPLVFNNGCASYSGICDEFLRDASFYVGTARPVDSFSAVEVAKKFASNLKNSTPVGRALFEAQRDFTNEFCPYLLGGVPWLSLPFYPSASLAILNANKILKAAILNAKLGPNQNSESQAARALGSQIIYQEQQRKKLLKQLFALRSP
jgi:hypothetical protein